MTETDARTTNELQPLGPQAERALDSFGNDLVERELVSIVLRMSRHLQSVATPAAVKLNAGVLAYLKRKGLIPSPLRAKEAEGRSEADETALASLNDVRVKALEWERDDLPTAKCVFGHYVINPRYHHVELLLGYGGAVATSLSRIEPGGKTTVEELKRAAQADYERRIREALDLPPLQEQLLDEAVVLSAAVHEYRLAHPMEGQAEEAGRRAAIRGMMIRLGLYDRFVEAAKGVPQTYAG